MVIHLLKPICIPNLYVPLIIERKRGNFLNPFSFSRIEGSRTLEGRLSQESVDIEIFMIYVNFMCEMSMQDWPVKPSKPIIEKILTVIIGCLPCGKLYCC